MPKLVDANGNELGLVGSVALKDTVKLPKFHLNHDISFAVDDEDKAPNDYQIKIGKLAKKKKGKK